MPRSVGQLPQPRMSDGRILACLPATVASIADRTRSSRHGVSSQLSRMRDSGLVTVRSVERGTTRGAAWIYTWERTALGHAFVAALVADAEGFLAMAAPQLRRKGAA